MSYTKANLRGVEDSAPKFDMPAEMHARFARSAIEGETLGLSLFTLAPGFRIPFGHRHEDQEEVYVVIRGSARIKVGDDVIDLAELDAVRVPGDTIRNLEAGPDGAEILAFGEQAGEDESEMVPGWWGEDA
jgi:quercetin dioxygenase-like cupin family protein